MFRQVLFFLAFCPSFRSSKPHFSCQLIQIGHHSGEHGACPFFHPAAAIFPPFGKHAHRSFRVSRRICWFMSSIRLFKTVEKTSCNFSPKDLLNLFKIWDAVITLFMRVTPPWGMTPFWLCCFSWLSFNKGVTLFFIGFAFFPAALSLGSPFKGERSLIIHLLKGISFAHKYFTHTPKSKWMESSVSRQFLTRRRCPAGRLPAIDHFQGHPGVRRMSGEPTLPAGHGPEGLLFKLHGFDQEESFIVLHREGIFNIHGFPGRNVQDFHLLRLRIVPHLKHNVQHFLPNVQG